MEDTIRAIIGEDHSHICTSASLGRTGENFITLLEITLPEKLCDYWPYLDFEKPDGETMRTPRLDINDCKITYDVPLALLDEDGHLEIQVVLQKESGEIWKSHPKKYVVFKSIDAVDDIPEKKDFITEAQKLLDEIENSGGGGGAPAPRIVNVSIYADKWIGENSPFSQVVKVEGATRNSQVDLTPSVEQLSVFYNKSLAFVTENVDGVVTVYAIGEKPENDYTMQATVKEVKV